MAIALQEGAITRAMLDRQTADRSLTPEERMCKQRDEKFSRLSSPPEPDPLVRTPVSMRMVKQSSKIIFEGAVRFAGLSILF